MGAFGTIKRIVAIGIAILIVLAAGVVVGQAPILFDVNDDPTASIEFSDQHGDGSSVTIDEVTLSDGGFVVVTDGTTGVRTVSPYLDGGTHENVTIERVENDENGGELLGQLTATVHRDTTDDGEFAFDETDGQEDVPYLDGGYPVSDTATVTADDDAVDYLGESFRVESIDAPDTATTNETIQVNATVGNPMDSSVQQHVEFRLDGEVRERQVLELDAQESTVVTFDIDTSGTHPGNQSVGVFTMGDGALATIDFEFHAPANIEVVSVEDDNITVDAVVPERGFVSIVADADIETNETDDENETVATVSGTTVGTSEQLDPGEYTNLSVELDDNDSAETNLTAVLFEGDPEDPDTASVFVVDGDPVIATVSDDMDATEGANGTSDSADEDEDEDEDGDEDGDGNGDGDG